jgi:pimeloyl-ACP methyl ester carboxylesterase
MEFEDAIIHLLHRNSESLRELIETLDIKVISNGEREINDAGQESGTDLHIEEEIEKRSSKSLLGWTAVVNKFPTKIKFPKLKALWKNRLVRTASQYIVHVDEHALPTTNHIREQFLYPVHQDTIPILYVKTKPSIAEPSTAVPGAHLIVLVHGYQGSAHDVRILRNQVACMCPDALVFSSTANEAQTDGDIESMGIRLVMELREFIERHSTSFFIISRISFIAHSLGGLIVRAALPALTEYKKKFHLFISLSTPHLGVSSKLIEGGIIFLRLFKRTEVLEQLTLKDSMSPITSSLYRLSKLDGLNWFRRVIFVGSSQDRYSLTTSSLVSPDETDELQSDMAYNINSQIENKVLKIDVEFTISHVSSLDSLIGRAAHIKFLESPVLVQLLLLSTIDIIDI